MTNITMLVHSRPRLTRQALESLSQNTSPEHTLTVLNDGSDAETQEALLKWNWGQHAQAIRNEQSIGTGEARNQVIRASEKLWGRGEYLYLSDNDVFFQPNWLERLIVCFEAAQAHRYKIVGAYNHPYHHPLSSFLVYAGGTREVCEFEAVAMQSWLLRWETWDEYGEFLRTEPNAVRQSEDHEWCQRIRQDGFKVGAVRPPLVYNCGRTDSFGQPIPGAELIENIPGVIVE